MEEMTDGYGSWYLELTDDEREGLIVALDGAMAASLRDLVTVIDHGSIDYLAALARNLGTLGRVAIRLRDLGDEEVTA